MSCRLSICIPTLNRATYIGETLESIVSQLEDGVEVVVVDGGSTDGTEEVVHSYQRLYPVIRYNKRATQGNQPSNQGFDRDCSHAVEIAQGEYCWLMTDDDVLLPGAIRKILAEARKGFGIIVASVEVRNKDLDQVIVERRPVLSEDEVFHPRDWDDFAVRVGGCLTFVGAVIIRRNLWLERDPAKYFGSGFVHVGVIFDQPVREDVLVVAKPLVSVRHGNAQWSTRAFQIWMINWPELVWSFPTISDASKQLLAPPQRWRSLRTLLLLRALGSFSVREYQAFLRERLRSPVRRACAHLIARLPRSILYAPAFLYLRAKGSEGAVGLFDLRNGG